MANITYKLLMKIWLQQLILLLLISLVLWWFQRIAAYSFSIGGLIYIIPNIYFAIYAFRYRGAQAAQLVLVGIYRGEIGKFLLSGVGFAIAFTLVNPLNVMIVFVAFIAFTIIQWIQLANIQ